MEEYIQKIRTKNPYKLSPFERIFLGIYKTENNFDSKLRKQIRYDSLIRRSFRFSNFLKFRAIYKIGIDNKKPFIELWKNNCNHAIIRLYKTGKIIMFDDKFSSNDIRFINIFLEKFEHEKVNKQVLLNNIKENKKYYAGN